jgi:site-specific DNA-cytosine methylase
MNSYKKSNDARNSLVLMYLAYADFYRPKYFLLENVMGLLHNKVGLLRCAILMLRSDDSWAQVKKTNGRPLEASNKAQQSILAERFKIPVLTPI